MVDGVFNVFHTDAPNVGIFGFIGAFHSYLNFQALIDLFMVEIDAKIWLRDIKILLALVTDGPA
jgi:hypothetical protein